MFFLHKKSVIFYFIVFFKRNFIFQSFYLNKQVQIIFQFIFFIKELKSKINNRLLKNEEYNKKLACMKRQKIFAFLVHFILQFLLLIKYVQFEGFFLIFFLIFSLKLNPLRDAT
eukprot:TRINITY_DN34546_c1_g1_i1.p3 TRINITY_DN34546_c1_g1~~TRINITY_DN34546_c1_g1_i1.p3  ORF type:complete len:114 (-),score=5.55 TRINITY_DN34546_c1_g1_i1:226-567(-)